MANINDGTPTRVHNARFYHGNTAAASADLLMEMEQVVVSDITLPDTESIPLMNGAALGDVLDGDAREGRMTLRGRFTSQFTADSILSKLKPAATAGKKTYWSGVIQFPDYAGASTGQQIASAKFYCPEQVRIVPGQDHDRFEAVIAWRDGAVPAAYGGS